MKGFQVILFLILLILIGYATFNNWGYLFGVGVDPMWTRYWDALTVGEYNEARTILDEFESDPNSDPAWFSYAETYYYWHLGRYDEALRNAERLDYSRANPENYLVRGWIHYDMHNYDAALDDFERALNIGLEDPSYTLITAWECANEMGDFELADEYEARIDSMMPDSYVALGVDFKKAVMNDDAAEIERLARVAQNFEREYDNYAWKLQEESFYYSGYIDWLAGDSTGAYEFYSSAHEGAPDEIQDITWLISVLGLSGNYDEIIPWGIEALSRLNGAYLLQDLGIEVPSELEETISGDEPMNHAQAAWVLSRMGKAYLRMGDLELSQSCNNLVFELNPYEMLYYLVNVETLMASGDIGHSVSSLEETIRQYEYEEWPRRDYIILTRFAPEYLNGKVNSPEVEPWDYLQTVAGYREAFPRSIVEQVNYGLALVMSGDETGYSTMLDGALDTSYVYSYLSEFSLALVQTEGIDAAEEFIQDIDPEPDLSAISRCYVLSGAFDSPEMFEFTDWLLDEMDSDGTFAPILADLRDLAYEKVYNE